jgi:hypothetical protein
MPMRAERRRNVFQSQLLCAKKRSKTEMSGQMLGLDEKNSQNEFTLFSPTGDRLKRFQGFELS